MSFGSKLKNLRVSRNLSQLDLAKALQVSQKTISNYEKGDRQPDFDTLEKIAIFFDISTDFLLGRTDNPAVTSDKRNSVFSERFKKSRLKYNMTEEQLANKLLVPVSSISMWENNEIVPDTFILSHIAKIFDTSIDYLIGLVDDEKKTSIDVQPTNIPLVSSEQEYADLVNKMRIESLAFLDELGDKNFFNSFDEAIDTISKFDHIINFLALHEEKISNSNANEDFKFIARFSRKINNFIGLSLPIKINETIKELDNLTIEQRDVLKKYSEYLFNKHLLEINSSLNELKEFSSSDIFSNYTKLTERIYEKSKKTIDE